MVRWKVVVLATSFLATLGASIGSCQQRLGGIAPLNSPSVYSPYLNLARGGNAGLNYYGLVRPQIGFQNTLLGLQTQVNQNQQLIATGLGGAQIGTPVTGHSAYYLNTGGYFLTQQRPGFGGQGAGGQGSGGQGANQQRFGTQQGGTTAPKRGR